MGCCFSSSPTTATKRDSHHSPKPPSCHHQHSSPPPPLASLEEQETVVKEVVHSETPITVKPPSSPSLPSLPPQHKNTRVRISQESQAFITNNNNNNNKKHEEEEEQERATPEISQASEICNSITDTLSTATTVTTAPTTTITELREDEATSKKRVNRSPVKVPRKRPYIRETSKSPAGRERLQAKRELSGQGRTTQRNVGSSGVKKGVGELGYAGGGGRRSKSPATRTAGGAGRGRAGGSPGKVTGRTGSRSVGAGVQIGVNNKEERNDGVLMMQQRQQQQEDGNGNESLENPLVALECFIFV